MTGINSVRSPSSGRGPIIAGIVLLALGAVGIVLYASGATAELSEAGSDGVTQALTAIGAAVCAGVGALLLAVGLIRRHRSKQ